MTAKQWYAIYTRPNWEKKVATLLTKKNIEAYCPLTSKLKQWSDRKKQVDEPLFKSYVFVCLAEHEHLSVKQTDGIVSFVYWLSKPAVIRPAEIASIKSFVETYSDIILESSDITLNDKVQVSSNQMDFGEGKVVELRDNFVKVMLPSLGYMLVAKKDCVRIRMEQAFAGKLKTVA